MERKEKMGRNEKMERDKKIGSDETTDRDEKIESNERMEMDEKTGGSIGMKMDGRMEQVGKMEREVGRTMGIGKDEVFLKWGERRDEEWSEEWEERYWEVMGREGRKVVVLDDDPTGIQTVHGVFVYTDAGMESIRAGLLGEERVFFILTNSRALGEEETVRLHREIGRKVAAAAEELGGGFLLVSRGDSTLRGHYPAETESLREGLEGEGVRVDGEVICPFFEEGGRFTAGDVHYVEMGDGRLVPAGETEFARDSSFGYVSSDLKDWVEEKSGGKVKREDVVSVSLEALRKYRIGEVADKLMGVEHFGKVVVNAVSYEDLKVFVIALLKALGRGKYFLFRTAASFVKVLGGMEDRALLEGADLYGNVRSRFGGLVVVGSHVQKTTRQLEVLRKREGLCFLEFSVEGIGDEEKMEAEKRRVLKEAGEQMAAGVSVVIYTGRQLRMAESGKREDNLALSVRISEAVTDLVGRMPVMPRFLVAKGGITSSDIGTKALGVKKAFVPGQILAGVPVWVTGEESRFPGIPYVIFPGNVGAEDALLQVVEKLEAGAVTGE